MPYRYKPEVVHRATGFLDQLLEGLESYEVLEFDAPKTQLDSIRYKWNEALAVAKAYPELYEGRYAGLRDAYKIELDVLGERIKLVPKAGAVEGVHPDLKPHVKSEPEFNFLTRLKGYKGGLLPYRVKLTNSTLKEFRRGLAAIGYGFDNRPRKQGGIWVGMVSNLEDLAVPTPDMDRIMEEIGDEGPAKLFPGEQGVQETEVDETELERQMRMIDEDFGL